jgi:hypothetical protein
MRQNESELQCIFCGEPADDGDMDDNGAVACKQCAAAEWEAQRAEGFVVPAKAAGRG